jgi:hypothetical protein
MTRFIFSGKYHDGRQYLSHVGINIGLTKSDVNNGARPVLSGWMFKALEELSFEYEPCSFIHTEVMYVYLFFGDHDVHGQSMCSAGTTFCADSLSSDTDRYSVLSFHFLLDQKSDDSWRSLPMVTYCNSPLRSRFHCGSFC